MWLLRYSLCKRVWESGLWMTADFNNAFPLFLQKKGRSLMKIVPDTFNCYSPPSQYILNLGIFSSFYQKPCLEKFQRKVSSFLRQLGLPKKKLKRKYINLIPCSWFYHFSIYHHNYFTSTCYQHCELYFWIKISKKNNYFIITI